MANIKRGCGARVPGGIYLVTDVTSDRWALPIDAFLFDPVWIPRNEDDQYIYPSPLGVTLTKNPHNPNTVDVWDWIGDSYYPYFPDFWEEVRRFGLSRRVSPHVPFALLNSESQLIGFHSHGAVDYSKLYSDLILGELFTRGTSMDTCPKHLTTKHHCVRELWQLVDTHPDPDHGYVKRIHPVPIPRSTSKTEFIYKAAYIPPSVKLVWQTAAMFHLPIHRIEIIEDKIEHKDEYAMKSINNSGTHLPIKFISSEEEYGD